MGRASQSLVRAAVPAVWRGLPRGHTARHGVSIRPQSRKAAAVGRRATPRSGGKGPPHPTQRLRPHGRTAPASAHAAGPLPTASAAHDAGPTGEAARAAAPGAGEQPDRDAERTASAKPHGVALPRVPGRGARVSLRPWGRVAAGQARSGRERNDPTAGQRARQASSRPDGPGRRGRGRLAGDGRPPAGLASPRCRPWRSAGPGAGERAVEMTPAHSAPPADAGGQCHAAGHHKEGQR